MAQEFSSKEAKLVLERHQGLSQTLENLTALPAQVQRDAENAARQLQARRFFENIARDGLVRGTAIPDVPNGAQPLLAAVVRCRKVQPLADFSRKMNDYHRAEVQAQCKSLRDGGSGLRRMFASAQKKQDAQQAYEALSALLSGNYAANIENMDADRQRIMALPDNALLAAFAQDRAAYRQTAQEMLPGFAKGAALPEVAQVLQAHERLELPFRNAESALEQSKQAVAAAAKQLAAGEVLNVLKGVPVEEAGREASGLRVKALRDSGFATMADIYSATPQQLAAVKGISDEGAAELKKVASDYAYRTAGAVKIRLSADNRTPAATNVVCAVCRYLSQQDGLQAYREAEKENAPTIENAKEALQNAGNGFLWLFESDSERQSAQSAFRTLSEMAQGGYAAQMRALAAQLSPAANPTAEAGWADFARDTVRYTNVLEELVPNLLGSDSGVYGLPEDLARAIQAEPFDTTGLRCTLRGYQEWGVKYILNRRRVLLGDEMGLGKTVQAIAAMVSRRNAGATHFAVVCPASVLANWCREIAKHSDLAVYMVHGSARNAALARWVEQGGTAVTTYETTAQMALEDDFRFDMLVVDEAHYIKNAAAQRSVNVKKLCEKAERLLFMTGTAIENKVDAMIALMNVLQPEVAAKVKGMAFMASAPQFREAVSPVYYRRRREDVLTELPEKTESKEWCTLAGEEEKLYEQAVLNRRYADARRVSWSVPDLAQSCKAKRLQELLNEALEEERKVIVFSFFLDTIEKVCAMLGERCVGPINGSVTPQRRQQMIDEFDKAPAGAVLAAHIQSGGTGLNIQSASVIVICEPQLKPSIENQAISRAYRMGQARNVLVYRLLCENTLDEKITDMLAEKQAVFDAFADKSAVAEETMELDQATLGTIIDEEIKRINEKNQATEETP